jgi:FeS assembly SUF system regulator
MSQSVLKWSQLNCRGNQDSNVLRISKLTDYATVILACLATRDERLYTATELAELTHLSPTTVSKLLKKLNRGGLVSSGRGSHGGYQLAKPASEITAAAILDALEGPFALTECSSTHSNCSIASSCHVGHSWQFVNAAIHRALSDVSLSQLAGLERAVLTPLDFNATRNKEVPLTRMPRPR